MPNTCVRATADGMLAANLNRRLALLGGLSAAAALAVMPRTTHAAAAPMTARERFDHHLAEMKKAAAEIDPRVRFDRTIEHLGQPDMPLAILVVGQWATGRYEGDGVYAGGGSSSKGERYDVTLLDTNIDGQRGFSVIKIGETDRRKWMTQSETALEAFIGKKVTA